VSALQTTGTIRDRYDEVAAAWPDDIPALSAQEAVSAAKRLYRFGMGKAFKGTFRITSGNRYSYIRGGVFYVNPERGWRELIHSTSHLVFSLLHPEASGHDPGHVHHEREMAIYAVSRGWLRGSLKSAFKPLQNTTLSKLARIDAAAARWQKKLRRAETAIKKLKNKRQYYVRKEMQS
jgi:hypothetical protein